ncbi:MAG TPA: hypothetical protein DCK81_05905, partial [Clostridiales bacterium UBA9856]|nr:hypothetical protein [Clostridiales bacterium UBA9856]
MEVKRRRVVSLVLCFIMIFTLWQPVFADGDTLTWTGEAGDGSWHNAGNWDLGRVPGSGDKVVIPEETVVEVVYETEPVELDCAGDLWIESGGHLYLTGTSYLRSFDDYVFDIFGDGNITITGEGSELHLDEGYIEGEGTLTIDPGASLILDTGSVEDGAGIGWHLVNDGQVLVESGWLFLYGSGEGEGAFTIAEEASLIFEGTFNVGGDVINSGELYLWYNANVYFEGDYRQDNTGLTTINIDNSDEYGKLNIGGEANLDGTLVIDIYYYPAPGASFEVLTYGSRNGEFSEIIIDRDDVEFEVEYRENSLVLSVEADTEPPELISLIPESGATVPPNLDRLTMVFSEPVWGDWNKSGSVYNAETNSHVRWLNFSEYDDQNISGNGTDTITLYIPAGTFEMGKSYYIEIDEGALVDRGGNEFAGISGSSEWTFTVLNDTQPPTAPANLLCSSKTSTSITLQWDPSSDDYGPIGYDIYGKKYGDFVLIGSTETTSFTVLKIGHSFLEPESEYTFKVIAVDGNGN